MKTAIGENPAISGKKVIVQGFGNVGYHSAKYLAEFGATVVGICEFEGAVYNEFVMNGDSIQIVDWQEFFDESRLLWFLRDW